MGPFKSYAWVILVIIVIILIITHIFIALVLTWPFSWYQLVGNMSVQLLPNLDDSSDIESVPEVELRYLNGVWVSSTKVFFIAVALFYELAVVNFVLSSNLGIPTVVLLEVNKAQFRKYGVVKDSAQSMVFGGSVREEFRNKKLWFEANSGAQLFDKINDTSDKITYVVIFELSAKFDFLCGISATRSPSA